MSRHAWISLAAVIIIGVALSFFALARGRSESYAHSLPGTPHVELDMDPTNGTGPCNPVDATAQHATGETYAVAVCLSDSPQPPGGFQFDLTYDDTLDQCLPVVDEGQGRDGNPDANAGVTVFSSPNLGSGWSCYGIYSPICDRDAAAGPGHGVASLTCSTIIGTATLPYGAGVSSPLAVVTFGAFAPGVDNVSLRNVEADDRDVDILVQCIRDSEHCFGGSDLKTGEPVPPLPSPTPRPPTPVPVTPVPATLEIDMDPTNGSGPCNPVDTTVEHVVGETYLVAVCLTDSSAPPLAFQFDLVYDDTLNECVPRACGPDDERCLDSNPDANAGSTVLSAPDLGSGFTCNVWEFIPPLCDKDGLSGANHGVAFLECSDPTGTMTLPVGQGVSKPIAEVEFRAIGQGSDSLRIHNATLVDRWVNIFVDCYDGNQTGTCAGGTDVKSLPPTPTSTATRRPYGVGGGVMLPPAAMDGSSRGSSPPLATWMVLAGAVAGVLAMGGYARQRRRRR